jgi:DNA-binding transcriptional regulator YdaS (Cro superfamily)
MDRLKIRGAIVAKYGSQCLFAREIGVSECRLSRLINGFQELKPEEARVMREKLGVELTPAPVEVRE